ncbi:AP-5 complex subunit sigma-1-like [Lingula anatina]|uniref:AP-5 complex subunit sigma-1-like n=1 Tax=Lingula anatina TaxID=7574 RepID=A0A1S3HTC6_LINAN|nr:AP-5 complex subunit sigma-1-like [Lingula anatina]|eukprot:XP_013389295.2 AP-5 complex subunit sigma-1-like [Lingula anatina]
MVYAFIIHTVSPGTCRIIYSSSFGQEIQIIDTQRENDPAKHGSDLRTERKQNLHRVAQLVQSEFAFRRVVTGKTLDDDLLKLNNEGTLPEFELGYIRLPVDEPFQNEKIVVWMAAVNCGFTMICEKNENRSLAENVLKLLIRYLQEHLRILNQPTEAMTKVDKIAVVLDIFLPSGQLLFMNRRLVRQFEKDLELISKG